MFGAVAPSPDLSPAAATHSTPKPCPPRRLCHLRRPPPPPAPRLPAAALDAAPALAAAPAGNRATHRASPASVDPVALSPPSCLRPHPSPPPAPLTPPQEGTFPTVPMATIPSPDLLAAVKARGAHIAAHQDTLTVKGVLRLVEADLGLPAKALKGRKTEVGAAVDAILSQLDGNATQGGTQGGGTQTQGTQGGTRGRQTAPPTQAEISGPSGGEEENEPAEAEPSASEGEGNPSEAEASDSDGEPATKRRKKAPAGKPPTVARPKNTPAALSKAAASALAAAELRRDRARQVLRLATIRVSPSLYRKAAGNIEEQARPSLFSSLPPATLPATSLPG